MTDSRIGVLLVSHYPTLEMGGQKSMLSLAEGLDHERFRVYAVTPGPGELTEALEECGCPVTHLPLCGLKLPNARQIVQNIGAFRRLYAEQGISIVHPDAERDAAVCGVAAAGTATRLVWHVRTEGSNNLDRLAALLSRRIIGVSESVGGRFSESVRKKKFSVVFNGIDTERFLPGRRTEARGLLGLPLNRKILLFAGQLRKEKGFVDAIKAFAEATDCLRAEKEVSDLPLLLVAGSAADQNVLAMGRDAAAGLPPESVRFLGYRDDLPDLLAASDLLLLPSHAEGLSRTALEAMASGSVPIISNAPGLLEAVTPEIGYVAPISDVPALARQIILAIEGDPERMRRAKAARARTEQFFSLQRYVGGVESVYSQVLRFRRRAIGG